MKTQWTAEQRTEALQLLSEHGKGEASRRTGIPEGTISSWAVRHGVHAPAPEKLTEMHFARGMALAERKRVLADRLLDEAASFVGQLHSPVVEKVVKVVPQGGSTGSVTEVVEVKYSKPPTADAKRIVESIGVLVDKIQLLTGDVTARTELVGGEQDRSATLATVTDLLARRAA